MFPDCGVSQVGRSYVSKPFLVLLIFLFERVGPGAGLAPSSDSNWYLVTISFIVVKDTLLEFNNIVLFSLSLFLWQPSIYSNSWVFHLW
jgi:hypothetical protein